MAFEYKQGMLCARPFNPEQCKASVNHDWHYAQCSRNPWKDGWCKQHHPDSIETRYEKSLERYKEQQENSPFARAAWQIKELKTRAKTSLYVPPELFPSFIKFLNHSINDMLMNFGGDLDTNEIKQIELMQAFCEQHQEADQ